MWRFIHCFQIIVLVAPSATYADLPPDTHRKVARLRAEGKACYRKRNYSCALAKFQQAFGLHPDPKMRFNLASSLDKLGHTIAALQHYRLYLIKVGADASAQAVRHIEQRRKLLLPKVGTVILTTDPVQVQVKLDGVPLRFHETAKLGRNKIEILVEPQRHVLAISSPGYLSKRLQLSLAAGDRKRIAVALVKPIIPLGHGVLSLTSEPSQAQIAIDGKTLRKTTPLTHLTLEQGAHTIHLLAGALGFMGTVKIRPGKQSRVHAVLRPAKSVWLIHSIPSGAKIVLNGQVVGETPSTLHLLPGNHTLALSKAKHFSKQMPVVARPFQPGRRISITLPQKTLLTVKSIPPNASVTVDGEHRGQTPLTCAVTQGNHHLKLTHSWYHPQSHEVTTSPQRVSTVQVTLSPNARFGAKQKLHGRLTIWGYSLLGFSAAAGITMATLYGVGMKKGDSAHQRYNGATTAKERRESADEVKQAEKMLVGGHVMAGIMSASLVASLVVFISRSFVWREKRDKHFRVFVSPQGGAMAFDF